LSSIAWNMRHVRCWRNSGSATSNLQLRALGVKLWSICLVLCDQLMSDEIISWRKILWKRGGPCEFGVNNGSSPAGAAERWRRHAHLINLEPIITTAIARFDVCRALVQPDHNWPLLMSPLCPFCGDYRATCDVGNKSSGCASIAHNFRICDQEGRIIVGPLSFNSCRRRGRGVACVTKRMISSILVSC